MRFMIINKVAATEDSGSESQRLVEQMGAYIDIATESGVFKEGAHLQPSSQRVRLVVEHGKPTVTQGPNRGSHELIASCVTITVASFDRAIAVGTQLAHAHGRDVEIEIAPLAPWWDVDPAAKPDNESPRFVLLRKADGASETDGTPTPALTTLLADLASDGVVLSHVTMLPSRRGARMDSKRSWTEGPFAASTKEIAGFAIVELPSLSEAKKWAEDYGALLGTSEVDVREVEADDRAEPRSSIRDGYIDPRLA